MEAAPEKYLVTALISVARSDREQRRKPCSIPEIRCKSFCQSVKGGDYIRRYSKIVAAAALLFTLPDVPDRALTGICRCWTSPSNGIGPRQVCDSYCSCRTTQLVTAPWQRLPWSEFAVHVCNCSTAVDIPGNRNPSEWKPSSQNIICI